MTGPVLSVNQVDTTMHIEWTAPTIWDNIALSDFSIVVLGDTQDLSDDSPAIKWPNLANYIASRPAVMPALTLVLHVGDIVNTGEDVTSWEAMDSGFDLLDAATPQIPYLVAKGQHDVGVSNYYETYFGQTRYTGQAWWSGDFRAVGKAENSYYLFSAGGVDWVAINACGPSVTTILDTDTITWVDGVLTAQASRKAILLVHQYLETATGTRYASCEDIWTMLKTHANLCLVVCGHNGATHRVDSGDNGNSVVQIETSSNTGTARVIGVNTVTHYIHCGRIVAESVAGAPYAYTSETDGYSESYG